MANAGTIIKAATVKAQEFLLIAEYKAWEKQNSSANAEGSTTYQVSNELALRARPLREQIRHHVERYVDYEAELSKKKEEQAALLEGKWTKILLSTTWR